jgi:2-C-methyl-D-erythritol 4-phosphate cytidylyltransferase
MAPSPSIALLVPAAGLGRRMGQRKPFLELRGRPVLCHALDRFLPLRPHIVQTVLLVHDDDLGIIEREYGELLRTRYGVTDILAGGEQRQDTVRIGLERVDSEADLVAIHDSVRPFVAPAMIQACVRAAADTGAAIVAMPMKPTVKRVAGWTITDTVPRQDLWCAQTPQVFRRSLILRAYEQAAQTGLSVTDDAQMVEALGHPVAVVEGSELNLKITTPEDLRLAEAILAADLVPGDDVPPQDQ